MDADSYAEGDEQVCRPIALILAVVAFELAPLGRDRLADLADELGWALVETDYRALRIGRFGIEDEHVLHAGNVLPIDLRNAPHVVAPGLEVVFGQTSAHCLTGDTVVLGEPARWKYLSTDARSIWQLFHAVRDNRR